MCFEFHISKMSLGAYLLKFQHVSYGFKKAEFNTVNYPLDCFYYKNGSLYHYDTPTALTRGIYHRRQHRGLIVKKESSKRHKTNTVVARIFRWI